MVGWNDYNVKREQYRDMVRDADQHRMIKQATDGGQESALGQGFRNLVLAMARRRPASDQVPCGEPTRLLEKAA